jgi:D-alanyl-D-alanine carboxypeptidase
VPPSGLRLLTVSYRDFAGQVQTGQLIVNKSAARPLVGVFRRLYRLRFPIRHMSFSDMYGPSRGRPTDRDVSGSFHCRQAVPSPCTGGTGTGSWSMHAYGLAIDLNPRENPYVGCGQSRDPAARRYRDRSRHRRGMVTRRVVDAFGSIGWGWGGSWSGDTKDYMHFSSTGR